MAFEISFIYAHWTAGSAIMLSFMSGTLVSDSISSSSSASVTVITARIDHADLFLLFRSNRNLQFALGYISFSIVKGVFKIGGIDKLKLYLSLTVIRFVRNLINNFDNFIASLFSCTRVLAVLKESTRVFACFIMVSLCIGLFWYIHF